MKTMIKSIHPIDSNVTITNGHSQDIGMKNVTGFDIWKTNKGFTIYHENESGQNFQLSHVKQYEDHQDSFSTRDLALTKVNELLMELAMS